MAYKYFDRVQETSTTTGTGNITCGGAAAGYRAFSSVYNNGDTFDYCIKDQAGVNWETGLGTYNSSGNTISRSVWASSNSNALVNFASGALIVYNTVSAYHFNLVGTFASKPSASAVPSGSTYFATDLGTNGVLLISNGSIWKPSSGVGVIGQSYVAATATGTGTLAETGLATVTVPAGLLSANGSLRITTLWTTTNSANTKTALVRFSTTSGSPNGTAYLSNATTTVATARYQQQISNRNSVSSQVGASTGNVGFATSSGATITTAFNTASATYINIDGQVTTNAEVITLEGYTVEWMEP